MEDIRDVTFRTPTGQQISVADVSEVKTVLTHQNIITRNNQEPAVLINVLQQSDANTEQVSENVRERLDDLMANSEYQHMEASILFDQGELVDQAIGSLKNALILGGLFAMLVLFFFLRNLKAPLIIGISIPFSVIVTFVLVYFSGYTLNIMTLGGLALGIGMLVDNSIVVIESIYRHLNMGKDPKYAASQGTKEVGIAISASTLTTIAVFVPVVFVSGIVGDLFMQFSMTIAFSLLASLFVALTVVPMLASRILRTPTEQVEAKRQETSGMISLGHAVKWVLHHRFIVLSVTVLLFAGGLFGLTRVGTVFLPNQDQGFFTINVKMENGTALDKTNQAVKHIEDKLDDYRVIKDYFALVGGSQTGGLFGGGGSDAAQFYVKMKEAGNRDVSTAAFMENIRDDIREVAPDAEKISLTRQSSFGSEPNTLTFQVTSDQLDELQTAVNHIADKISGLEHTVEASNNSTNTVKEIQIHIDKEQANQYGLMPKQIALVINHATRGMSVIEITTASGDVRRVTVAYDEDVTATTSDLKHLLIQTPKGEMIELAKVVRFKKGKSPVTINRSDQERVVNFDITYANQTTLGEFTANVKREISELDLPDSVSVSYTGSFDLLQDTVQQLIVAFILAIVLIYLVMAAQFESFRYPFVIMLSVPLIFIGVSLGLVTTDTPISATVLIGLIVLAGIVVNNAIVLIDYILQLKDKGYAAFDAIVEGVKVRMRPILMTALTTILGLLPIALGIGQGTAIQQPMGITVIGGMISSTFLTLFVIPVVYSFFDAETRRKRKVFVTPEGVQIPAYLIDEDKAQKTTHDVIDGHVLEGYQKVSQQDDEIYDTIDDEDTESADEQSRPQDDESVDDTRSQKRESDEMLDVLEDLLRRAEERKKRRDDEGSDDS